MPFSVSGSGSASGSATGSGSGSGSSDTKSYTVTVRVMVPPADQSKRYTYKHDSRSYTNLLTPTSKVTVAAGSSVRDAFVINVPWPPAGTVRFCWWEA